MPVPDLDLYAKTPLYVTSVVLRSSRPAGVEHHSLEAAWLDGMPGQGAATTGNLALGFLVSFDVPSPPQRQHSRA
ncbi:hypothetical protein MetexDRAFT_5985 [Methylorubrum extorquens DSM 13060]|uniref:Uncharacterized protein n=2 Tax=Methylobacteriaceae TaxID=119045 RepID=A0A564G4U4_9HYPH|nr:hypothetical protein MetexDRAFT_5985 [Methylorubrum extorquens DSM 13060]GJD58777.1 hypothetical protein IFDJLNFL_4700 [Methylobacterium dankookense]VUF15519.1 hypothetical protein MTDSW087_05261 [Methylobacterium dankookense]